MADFVIPAPTVTAVPVAGGGAFPVRRVFCVGRNYAEHARNLCQFSGGLRNGRRESNPHDQLGRLVTHSGWPLHW